MGVFIGIIVHSHTGSTLDFADRIAQKLREGGHSVEVTQLRPDGHIKAHQKDVRILNQPDCTKYDAVLIGGPVWAFDASPAVMACLRNLKGVEGKKLLPFVTMRLPFEWMGGTQAIEAMRKAAEEAGAIVMPGIIAPRLFRRYSRLKERLAETISQWFVD